MECIYGATKQRKLVPNPSYRIFKKLLTQHFKQMSKDPYLTLTNRKNSVR